MEDQQVPMLFRDYCLDYYMDYHRCTQLHPYAMGTYCGAYKNAHEMCQMEEYVFVFKQI